MRRMSVCLFYESLSSIYEWTMNQSESKLDISGSVEAEIFRTLYNRGEQGNTVNGVFDFLFYERFIFTLLNEQ